MTEKELEAVAGLAAPGAPALAREVDEGEYARLLGYPDHCIPPGRVAAGAGRARAWYADRARPRLGARALELTAGGLLDDRIELAVGEALTSPVLAARLRRGGAHAVIAAGLTAGPEVDERSHLLWAADRPDEAYFVDRFGVAVAEHLALWAARELRARLGRSGLGLLPSSSPGHHGWSLDEQRRVADCLGPPFWLEVLESGMIRPRSSLLAVFGVTRNREAAADAWRRDKCGWCALTECGFRSIRIRRPSAAESA